MAGASRGLRGIDRASRVALQADRVARRLWPGLLPPPPVREPLTAAGRRAHTAPEDERLRDWLVRAGIGVRDRRPRVKWMLRKAELRRLATLLTESVARGELGDVPLRDRCVALLQQELASRAASRQRLDVKKQRAGVIARMTFQRAVRKGV